MGEGEGSGGGIQGRQQAAKAVIHSPRCSMGLGFNGRLGRLLTNE